MEAKWEMKLKLPPSKGKVPNPAVFKMRIDWTTGEGMIKKIDGLKNKKYFMLIFIAAIIFLLIILFRKNITEYLENNEYIVGAGILLLISFVIIHLGNKNSAKVSKQETEELIEEVVGEAIEKNKTGLKFFYRLHNKEI